MGYGYASDALKIDLKGGSLVLRDDYDHREHRVEIKIFDDDKYLDGDYLNDEVGDDKSQLGEVYDMGGGLISKGNIYDEEFYILAGPGGETIWVEVMEIGGDPVGYLVSEPLDPGVEYAVTSVQDVYASGPNGDTRITYDQLYSVPCFGPGTLIATTKGDIPVEWLEPGDMVITRDHGAQSILWIGCYHVTADRLRSDPDTLAPYRVAPDSFGPDQPREPLLLSPQHRILLSGPRVEMFFGTDEVFAATKHLAGNAIARPDEIENGVSYAHILLQNHEVIMANGLWVESLFHGGEDALPISVPDSIRRRVEASEGHRNTARPCLRRWEAALFVQGTEGDRKARTPSRRAA